MDRSARRLASVPADVDEQMIAGAVFPACMAECMDSVHLLMLLNRSLTTLPLWPMPGYCSRLTLLGRCPSLTLLEYCFRSQILLGRCPCPTMLEYCS